MKNKKPFIRELIQGFLDSLIAKFHCKPSTTTTTGTGGGETSFRMSQEI